MWTLQKARQKRRREASTLHLTDAVLAARRGAGHEVEVGHRQEHRGNLRDPVDGYPGHFKERVLDAGAVDAALGGPKEGVGHGALHGLKGLGVVLHRGRVPVKEVLGVPGGLQK